MRHGWPSRRQEPSAWATRGPGSGATVGAGVGTGTGGCCDGLQEDRINRNQGAESTLAFLLSLAEMNLLESSLAAFRLAR